MKQAIRPRDASIDVLSDTLDEFEAQFFDLGSLVRDVGSTIEELAPVSDPAWIAELRGPLEILAGVEEQRKRRGDWTVSESEGQQVKAANSRLRGLLNAPRID
jgi:hypothetical protein